jgi:hypothetical protein
MYVFGRFGVIRSFMVWVYSQKASKPPSTSGPSVIEDVDVEDVAVKIRQDGFFFGLNLRKEAVEEFLEFSLQATCFGDGNVDLPFRYGDGDIAAQEGAKPFRIGLYKNALRRLPALRALASDPQLRAIARKYLQTEPALIGARVWWSLVGPADSAQQMGAGQGFHYDIDGYRGLTFFFYLTDVGPSNGPHIYVRGTHVKKSWKHLVSIYKGRSDAEIGRCYGPERQTVLCGPAGSGFAEDIFGFHKGLHPESADRLIVQVRYGLCGYVREPGD